MNDQITKLSDFAKKPPLFRVTELIWYALSVIQVLLVLRLVLKLFGANPTEGFTNVIYSITNYILYPFTSILGPGINSGNVFEWTTLLAVITYWMSAILIIKLLALGRPPVSRIEQARVLSAEKYGY